MSRETTEETCFCTPAVFYAYPSFHTDFCCDTSTSDYFGQDNSQCSLASNCKHPERVNGLDVELAVRREPFKSYPKKNILHRSHKAAVKEPKVPFVYKHKSPDPDLALLEKPVEGPKWNSRFTLKRIYSLIAREDSADQLQDRIRELWAYYEKISKDVFVYDNMDTVANLILKLSTSFIRSPYAQDIFDKIMQRLQRGIYMEASLKDVVDTKRLAYFFTCLGLAIVEGHPIAQCSIASILGVWLESMVEKKRYFYPKSTLTARQQRSRSGECQLSTSRLMKLSSQLTTMIPDNVLIAALEKSLLPRIICKYFIDGTHTEGYVSMLSLLKSCCDVSEVIRQRLLCQQVLDPILLRLAVNDPSNRILLTTCDFVHSYFGINSPRYQHGPSENEKSPDENSFTPILEKDSFQILLTRFVQQLSYSSSSKSSLNTRNDTAFMICLLCERVPISGEYFEGFEILLASIISSAILGMKGLDITYLIDSTPEDFEFLQYLLYMLKCIVEAGCGEQIIEDYSLVAVLLTFILGPCPLMTTPMGDSVLISGEGERGNDLETAVWTVIQAIAKHCPLSLLTLHGVPLLLTFLQSYGETGEGDQKILFMFIHIIRIILTTPEEDSCVSDEVMGYFIERDGVSIFLSVIGQLTRENFDPLYETVVCNVLYSCAALAAYDFTLKELFVSLNGVSILTLLMSYLLCNAAEKRHMNPVIQMALSECIGSCIAYYPPAMERFLEMEGIFRLLDLLELSAGPAAPVHITNCILQLCDYPRCVDQLMYWHRPMKDSCKRVVFGEEVDDLARTTLTGDEGPKSGDVLQEMKLPSDQSLSSLLCSLWKEEEDRFEVLRDPEGCIASITHPLMSKFARTYEEDQDENEGKGACKSCLDMSLSLRPKIFLLIKRIVEVTKTEATLFDGLSISNQVIMQVIINFVDLKKSEIYLEIADSLENENEETPTMIPGDEEDVEKFAEISRNTLATVLETQRYLIRRFNEKEETNENEFYALLKQCRLQDHLIAAKEIEYMARTTNYNFLVEKRLWQKSELQQHEKSLGANFTKNSRIHRVSDGELNITAWPCRTRYLISEPKLNTDEPDLETYDDNDDLNFPAEKDDDGDGGAEGEVQELLSAGSASTIAGSPFKAVPSSDMLPSYAITETVTPEPLEGGFYQVSPHRLREALRRLVAYRRRHQNWLSLAENDDNNYWQMRTKWKQDWYPILPGEQEWSC